MAEPTLTTRVEILEQTVQVLETLPARVEAVELQIVQLRQEMRAEFSVIRDEIRAGDEAVRTDLRAEIRAAAEGLRAEIRAGDEETRRYMRVLHEEVIASRVALRLDHQEPSVSGNVVVPSLEPARGGVREVPSRHDL